MLLRIENDGHLAGLRRPMVSSRATTRLLSVATIVLLLTQTASIGAYDESQPVNATSPATTVESTTTTTTTTTAAPPAIASPQPSQPPPPPPPTTTTPAPTTTVGSTTPALDVDKVKQVIREHITPGVENRFAMNKPTLAPQTAEFAPDSIEVKVADATTQFGLNFIKNLELGSHENLLISPISLQNLLNMILLGSDDHSQTQAELIKTLGYEQTDLLTAKTSAGDAQRLRPHEAMHNLLDSITRATHLIISPTSEQLLNTNPAALAENSTTSSSSSSPSRLTAHLQTATRDNETALSGQVNFTLANLLLTDDSLRLSDEFERNLKQFYNVKVESFSRQQTSSDLKNASSTKAAEPPLHEKVNKWVKNVTRNQIEQLASESDLSGDDLLMVLLNAAHFKGHWLYTFNPKATQERLFYNDGQERQATEVKFMRQKATFGYADFGQSALQAEWAESGAGGGGGASGAPTSSSEDAETLLTEDAAVSKSNSSTGGNNNNNNNLPTIELSKEETRRLELTSKLNCSVLQLPFSLNDGQELSMVILLPTKRDGLAELLGSLTYQALNEIYRSLSEQQVQVELPKFAFEAAHDAKTTLKRMGLSGIFSEAQLERMFSPANSTGSPAGLAHKVPKKVGKVIHKAKISVDEAGAEAAAASMATIVLRNFIRPPSPVFVADHPFLFIIRHNKSNVPLFMGRLSSLH